MSRDRAPRTSGASTLLLSYCPPFDWNVILAHLASRAVDGVEWVTDGAYHRVVVEGACIGRVTITHALEQSSLCIEVDLPGLPDDSRERARAAVAARVRRVFDVDADACAIGVHLASDPLLAPLVAQHPGLRVPGGWDHFELGVRAILGQQITVGAARALAGRLVALCGSPMTVTATLAWPETSVAAFAFPTAQQVADADLASMPMPAARTATLRAFAEALLNDPELLAPGLAMDDAVARLCSIRGIGPWTAQYIAMRALRDADAFPATDVALLRAATLLEHSEVDDTTATRSGARRVSAHELLAMAERWRPWRAYAAQHLWTSVASMPGKSPHPNTRTVR